MCSCLIVVCDCCMIVVLIRCVDCGQHGCMWWNVRTLILACWLTLYTSSTSSMQGGAVYIGGGSGTFYDCTFTGNTAVSDGVGITMYIYCCVLDCSSLGCEYSRIADSTSCFLLFSLCWPIIDAPYLLCVGRNFFSGTCRG